MKNIFSAILSKMPIFIFCVLFVSGYNALFGSENSTVGITILTALLIFLQADLGFNAKQAAFCFPVMLLVMGVAPKIASYNVAIGFFIHFAAIMLLLIISSYNIEKDNHVPFLLGYIFCEGYGVAGGIFEKRMVSLLIGGILVGLIYFLVNQKKSYDLNIKDMFKAVNLNTERTQWYIKLAFGLSLSMFLGELFHYPRTLWINFAILSLTHHHEEVRRERMKHRLPATIIGCTLFFLLFGCIPKAYQKMATMMLGFGMMFIKSYKNKTVANSFNALITAIVMFPTGGAVILRIVSNVIGIGFSYINQKLFDRLFSRRLEKQV